MVIPFPGSDQNPSQKHLLKAQGFHAKSRSWIPLVGGIQKAEPQSLKELGLVFLYYALASLREDF